MKPLRVKVMMLKTHLRAPLILLAAMIVVFVVELLIPGDLSGFGIRPRSIGGLTGVVLSPFLHGNIFHLIANAAPILVMGVMLSMLDPKLFIYRTVVLIVASGLLTWLISTSGVVVGASGLAFAYWAYLIVNGVKTKKMKDIIISLLTIILYGALLFSLFRYIPGVSWAGHFSGAIVGALFAWFGASHRTV